MLQLISRRFLRELDEAPGENNLQYILKCPCISFFGNQGLHNEIMLGGNGGRSGVMCKRSPYIYPPSKIAVSRSNGSGIENGVEVCPADVSWGSWVLPIVLRWKGQKICLLWQASRKGGDSSQLRAKGFMGRRRK